MTTFADDGHYGEALALSYEAGWTDGLPIVPPTAERVREFVEASGRSALELVGRFRRAAVGRLSRSWQPMR